MAEARDRLAAAQDNLASRHFAVAASAAYYAMLYAARAALSERELYAKTHSGIWSLFGEEYVARGDFDSELSSQTGKARHTRELGDYEAKPPSAEQAQEIVAVAERFLGEIDRVLD